MGPVDRRTQRATRLVAALLLIGMVGGLGAAVVYAVGGQPQLEGVTLAIAFGGLGAGLVVWGRRLLTEVDVSEHWEFAEPDDTEAEVDEESLSAFHDDLDRQQLLERRPLLRMLLAGSVGTIGLAAFFPIRSLGPNPGNSLRVTPWQAGRRLVDADGRAIRAAGVPAGGMVTAFPEGHLDAADAVAVVVRVGGRVPAAEGAHPEGFYAYSKICTHAGCPVGLYVDDRQTLLCPCHQSEFDVIDDARPLSGPAARPLPALPIEIDDQGVLIAVGDFDSPVGPAWWSL